MYPRILSAIALYLAASSVWAQDIAVDYGVVSDVTSERTSTSSAGARSGASAGGALGGLLGATSSKANSSGEKRRRSLAYGAVGALAGGAAGSSADSSAVTIYTYRISLLDGGTVDITTEQGRIDAGDCVSVERGAMNNIRKVAQVFCDVPGDEVYSEHIEEAAECSAAKQELVAAQGGEAIDAAIRKVKILCDD